MYHAVVSQEPISVVQLATGHVGGAGLAARRLHEQLLFEGVKSEFYCIERDNFVPGNSEYSISRSVWRKTVSRISIYLNQRFTSRTHFSVFSTNAASLAFFMRLSREKKAVLHFHNWQNLISQRNLIRLIKAGFPITLTIHDERATTGGCHYRLDCNKNFNGCQKCPRAGKLLQHKITKNRLLFSEIDFTAYPNFRIISPSKWLQDCSTTSLAIDPLQIVTILNPLGPNWNQEKFKYSLRDRFVGKIKIGVATMSDSFVKYGDLLDELNSSHDFQEKYEILYLRDFNASEGALPEFWREIDFLLALSRADNSPNSVLEARSLQIPILTSNIGGIPELLGEYDHALESEEHTVEGLLCRMAEITANIRDSEVSAPMSLHSNMSHFATIYSLALQNSKQTLEW
jgi:glycosyltransferase involved in cell wall biosynthesis